MAAKKIAVLHTVRSVMEPFITLLRESAPDCEIYNTLDEFLAIDANVQGRFTAQNKARLFGFLTQAAATGADLIVSSCSTLSPHLAAFRPMFEIPIVTIDDEMARQAAGMGERITVFATAKSAIGPVRDKILAAAETDGKHPTVLEVHAPGAFDALSKGNKAEHDRLMLEAAKNIQGQEVIALAQASMAHMADEIAAVCGCPVLTSPSSCIRQVCELLKTL